MGRSVRFDVKLRSGMEISDLMPPFVYKVGHKLYRQRIEGTIKPKHEEMLRKLGVRV